LPFNTRYCGLAVDLSSVSTFHYGLNTQSVFRSGHEADSETFKEISRLSFYLIYNPLASLENQHDAREQLGSIQRSLNLTATSFQVFSLWADSLSALVTAWQLCLLQKVRTMAFKFGVLLPFFFL
jgi:hypothetical protein